MKDIALTIFGIFSGIILYILLFVWITLMLPIIAFKKTREILLNLSDRGGNE